MNDKSLYRASRFLSLILRHRPDKARITLNDEGWTDVDALLEALTAKGYAISRDDLNRIVAENDKKRFSFSDDRTLIRASQGHSVEVAFDFPPVAPPERLYHGTVERFLDSIRQRGLKPKNRHHVHLSPDRETAEKVGARRGPPIILTIHAEIMNNDGHEFYRSDNGVWLTDCVPARYIKEI